MSKTVEKRIANFNNGRIKELLEFKYKRMRQDIFSFYRGSSHLYYEDLADAKNKIINSSPLTWVCGDLHLENFGSYKADNRLVYFDINDFDDATLAPCLWEVSRVLVSIIIAAKAEHLGKVSAKKLCDYFIEVYSQTLKEGHARLVEEETAEGIVYNLLHKLKKRKRKAFIKRRTQLVDGKRKLLLDGERTSALPKKLKKEIATAIKKWAKNKPNPDFYKILDISYRIAGTGSLGLERYVVLVKGKGDPNNYLLDIKLAKPSPVLLYAKAKQPIWENDAQRIVAIQKRMQAFPPALLEYIKLNGNWFVIKELQPTEDRVNLIDCNGQLVKLDAFIKTIASITAWAQLRSDSRQGSATTDALIEFASQKGWHKPLWDYVNNYSYKVSEYYKKFKYAYDNDYFKE